MAKTASEVRVFTDGGLWIQPIADFTTFPDIDEADPVGWAEVGWISEAGPQFSFGRDKTELFGWQSIYSLRTLITGAPTTVSLELMQWNSDTLALAAGGGTVTDEGGGISRFVPEDAATLSEYAAFVRGLDGTKYVQFEFKRTTLASATEFAFTKDASANFAVELDVLQPDSGAPWEMVTNDAAFEPTGS